MSPREAFQLMIEAHHGAVDKAGEPYIFHPIAVAESVRGLGDDFEVVALLHDVFEDTTLRIEEVWDELTPEQAWALSAITKEGSESYVDYLRRVRENFIAKVVKWADFNHNLSPERQQGLDPELAKKLEAKYERGRRVLLGEE